MHNLAVLGAIARLKLRLSLRYYQRNTGNAVAMALVMLLLLGAAVFGTVVLYFYCRAGDPGARESAFFWCAWLITAVWLSAPLTQFDTQISLDLNGLRLFPLGSGMFSAAALLDGVLSPLGLLIAPLGLGLLIALTLSWAELPWMLLALVLYAVALLALSQAVVFWTSHLMQSRRFADASIVITLVMFVGLQTANFMLQQHGQFHAPLWLVQVLAAIRVVFKPLLVWLFPGLAAQAFNYAILGDFATATAAYGLLSLEAGVAIWLAGLAARQFYGGELESGGSVRRPAKSMRVEQRRGLLGGAIGALFHRERLYVLRDPLLKLMFIQSLFSMVVISGMVVINIGHLGEEAPGAADYSRYVLLGAAVMLGFMESALLFNKFGYEGPLLTVFLLTPASRLQLLAAKSAFYLLHFATLNIALVIAIAVAVHAPLAYMLCAIMLVACNTAVVDLVGHYVSILYPFTYRRRGRRLRAVMAQPGCGYMVLYLLVFQLCNLAVAPGSAALIAGLVWGGAGGLACGALLYAVLLALGYKYALPHAAGLLVRREPELVALLTRSQQ